MDDPSHRPDRTLHACDCELGKDRLVGLGWQLLISIFSRPSGEGSTLLNTPAPFSPGMISGNLPSMCTSSRVFSISLAYIQVGSTPSPRHCCTTNTIFLKVLTYIDLSATTVGIAPEFSFYLVSITNAGSGLGRIVCGILADKLGALTITAPLTLLCAIMTYVWPFATTKGSLIAIGIIYGFCSGAYVSLLPTPLMMMGDMHDAGRRSGIAMSGIALGAVAGPPISGAIAQATGGFKAVGYYAGNILVRLPPNILLNLLLSPRIVHPRSGCVPIPHEIPNDRQFTWKMLEPKSKGGEPLSRPQAAAILIPFRAHRKLGRAGLFPLRKLVLRTGQAAVPILHRVYSFDDRTPSQNHLLITPHLYTQRITS